MPLPFLLMDWTTDHKTPAWRGSLLHHCSEPCYPPPHSGGPGLGRGDVMGQPSQFLAQEHREFEAVMQLHQPGLWAVDRVNMGPG